MMIYCLKSYYLVRVIESKLFLNSMRHVNQCMCNNWLSETYFVMQLLCNRNLFLDLKIHFISLYS